MSDEDLGRRSEARFLTDLDLVLLDLSGAVKDGHAQAHDVSPKGFRAETKTELAVGDKFAFELDVDPEVEPVTGKGQVVWVERNPWGWWNAGVKITKISWRDRRRLQSNLFKPGYDFVGLAKRAWRAVFWVIVVAGLNAIAFHQPHARKLLIQLAPVMVAAFVFGWGLKLLLER